MLKVVESAEDEGLLKLAGKNVLLLCANYFYTGKLMGINDTCVLLEDASIVYETGDWLAKEFKDAQKLPKPIYVQTASIESFMER
jgi:hypothetical protein